jgi:LytR cell envelope-related transcriptional attenuator
MNEGMGSEPPPRGVGRRAAEGFHHRSERRSAQRAARRRKAITRFWLVAGPLVVVIVAAAALFVVFGGPSEDGGAGTTSTATTAVSGPTEGGVLLVIEQGETAPVLLLFLRQGDSALGVGVPGDTLLKTAEGFKTVAELRASQTKDVLKTALEEAFGMRIGSEASVQWSALRAELAQAGQAAQPGQPESLPAELTPTQEDSALVAGSVVALFGPAGQVSGAEVWERASLEGDAAGFRSAIGTLMQAAPSGAWKGAALPGKPVAGAGFVYYEPDVQGFRALLGGQSANVAVTLEVQNGSGVVGAAEQAGAALEPLGYSLLPFANAEGFPDVKQTRIVTAPDVVAEAERVRSLLGVGRIEQDDALDPGRVIVVVGKDFVPPASTQTAPAG